MPNWPEGAIDVETAEAVRQAADHVQGAKELAVDVEADAMHAFRARLCFVQVATDERVYLFDTLRPEVRADSLAAVFADPARTKFFHAAGGDLQYLAEVGVRIRGLFDTHRAATLLGWQKVGLADLVRERLGIELKKEHQQSDFSIRPLPPGMREYIADDVRYLVEIGRQVREECRKADILEEVELDCARIAEEAAERPAEGALFRPKLPRHQLKPAEYALGLAIAARLNALRLQWAEAANVPMGRMLSNAAITAIATRPPSTLKELARLEGVRGAFVREHGEEVLSAIRELIALRREGKLPVPEEDRGPRDPNRRKRAEALKEFRTEKAKQRGVTGSVILSNALVDDLSACAPRSLEELATNRWLGEKRIRLYGAELVELLAKFR
ncbi:MAG: HRDC domain-containing protein [Myxococcaceae bacterium]|nr:HRDC domain-containing protein [Myxococcaceae bacterium]